MANSLLEAMVMARPVAARDVPGNRSLIRHGRNGWLFAHDEGMRDLVRSLLREPDRGLGVARQGREDVLRRCSPVREARRYARLYGRILGET